MESIELNYQLVEIKTNKFSLFEINFSDTVEINFSNQMGFNLVANKRILTPIFDIEISQKKKVFCKLSTEVSFNISEESWTKLQMGQEKFINFPKQILLIFGSLTVGTARGVLHSKLVNTEYERVILPPINLEEMMKEVEVMTFSI
jgi:hypothetical protein